MVPYSKVVLASHEMKRDGAGRGNWGIDGDHVDIHT